MSEPEPEIEVPYELRSGVWADDVDVFGDIEKRHSRLRQTGFTRRQPRSRRRAGNALALVHTQLEVEAGGIRVKKYEPQDWSYKMKPHKLTPEEEATLARWRQEIRARARLRER